jgi:hypothetical protein
VTPANGRDDQHIRFAAPGRIGHLHGVGARRDQPSEFRLELPFENKRTTGRERDDAFDNRFKGRGFDGEQKSYDAG